MISEQQLQELQEICDKASEGPWLKYDCQNGGEVNLFGPGPIDEDEDKRFWVLKRHFEKTGEYIHPWNRHERGKHIASTLRPEDTLFISAAREAVPELIARVRELEKEAAWLAERLASQCICPPGINECSDKQPISNCKSKWRDTAKEATK